MRQFQELKKGLKLYDKKNYQCTLHVHCKIQNNAKAKIHIFFLFFFKQVYMLPVKFHTPLSLHVTSYYNR